MLRIHFTGEDLAKLRLACRPIDAALEKALRDHHQSVVALHWDEFEAQFEADRAKRSRAWLDGGCDGLLNSYRPLMRWEYPILEMDFDAEQNLHLQGRGLLLVPSYVNGRTPGTLFDPALGTVLIYPMEREVRRAEQGGTDGTAESLAALIGVTRAWVLGAIDEGCTTSELARRVGVHASSISQHTTVLREARLIRTSRIGKAVMHTLTPLGASLLEGRAARARSPRPSRPSSGLAASAGRQWHR
jgi:DNA-binding transcriptional ArsR family regulator